jgi:hypothetical protein
MLVRLLMSLSEKYELEGTTIAVGLREVRAVFRFPEHDLPKLRAIAENWADAEGNKTLANSAKRTTTTTAYLKRRHPSSCTSHSIGINSVPTVSHVYELDSMQEIEEWPA